MLPVATTPPIDEYRQTRQNGMKYNRRCGERKNQGGVSSALCISRILHQLSSYVSIVKYEQDINSDPTLPIWKQRHYVNN